MLITSSFGASTGLLRSGSIHEVQCRDMTNEGKEGRERTEKIRIRIQQHTLTGGLWWRGLAVYDRVPAPGVLERDSRHPVMAVLSRRSLQRARALDSSPAPWRDHLGNRLQHH